MYALNTSRVNRFADIKLLLERIITHDGEFAKDDLAQFTVLTALAQASDRDLNKLRQIGKIIGVHLPLEKQDLPGTIQKIAADGTSLGYYIQGYAIKKITWDLYYIKLSTNDKNEVVTAFSYRERINKPDHFLADQETISLEDLYDRIDQKFHLIAFKDE